MLWFVSCYKSLYHKDSKLTNDQLIIKIARKFIGVPYVAHTLDINEDEKLVINLHGLDCTTYVEAVTALTLCVKKGETRFSDYVSSVRTSPLVVAVR